MSMTQLFVEKEDMLFWIIKPNTIAGAIEDLKQNRILSV